MGHSAHILCTRPLDDTLIAQAAEKNVVIDVVPMIATEIIEDKKKTREVQALALHPQIAIFTSVHAVEAIAGHLQQRGRKGPSHPLATHSGESLPWKIFCISGATRQSVQEYFGEDAIAGTAPSAGQLADVILRQAPGEIFFFCGDQRRNELPGKLSAAGRRVNEVVVYRTIRTPHKVETAYDGVAFFSPSAVQSFFSVNTLPATTALFAIGNTTADAIREHCSNRVIASPSPEQATLIRQIIDHFQSNI